MKDYQAITVQLKIEEDVSLLILLHKDGTINRKGNGSENIDKNFFIGKNDDNLLSKLAHSITPDFEEFLNKIFDDPDKKGKTCMLEISLSDEKETTGMRFTYGTKSIGPPEPVYNFVIKAVELTDPWFLKQKKTVASNEKKWWEFWK